MTFQGGNDGDLREAGARGRWRSGSRTGRPGPSSSRRSSTARCSADDATASPTRMRTSAGTSLTSRTGRPRGSPSKTPAATRRSPWSPPTPVRWRDGRGSSSRPSQCLTSTSPRIGSRGGRGRLTTEGGRGPAALPEEEVDRAQAKSVNILLGGYNHLFSSR
uniref:Uncharacterized protein n=1 Tax=Setaria viridis TaxID=4556 RepID=A0A4U6TA64_SETVI|nr:hypothetical protein SEVIR_9G515166v2 [Setaria viridis]